MDILERFLKYIKVPTTSDSQSNQVPSTETQKKLATILVEELKELEVDELYYDEKHCYIYALLKGTTPCSKIGFISHLDTSEEVTTENINPQIIQNYDGEDILLKENTLGSSKFPDLKNHLGQTLITTDGNTLLGADDKAGIAEIMSMIEYFKETREPHGDIYIAFTSDEEIGKGAKYLDFSKFKAEYAYTVDGSTVGEICYENFNAATAKIKIEGVATHCGYAKNLMINSILIANMINNLLPNEIPANTEGYEGFYHLQEISGTVSYTTMKYLIRDFDFETFENRKKNLELIVERLNKKYNNCIKLEITDTYYNMKYDIEESPQVLEIAKDAIQRVGVSPMIETIRGGTDGASLSKKGLPCPNLGTGGHNFHSIYEYITVEDMEKTKEILIEIVKGYANYKQYSLKR